jgi:hypothetical protein
VPAEEITAAPDRPDTPDTSPVPADTRRPRASLWALRVSALLHTVLIAAQPVLAGRYLAGDVDAITTHEINSHLVTTVGWVQIIAAVTYVWRGRGRAWPLVLSIVLAVCEETQKVLGYVRLADLHIPFGVTLLVIQVLLTIWLFGPGARRTRPAKEPT